MSENNSNPAYCARVTSANATLPLAARLNKANVKGRTDFKRNFTEKNPARSVYYLRNLKQQQHIVFNIYNLNISLASMNIGSSQTTTNNHSVTLHISNHIYMARHY